MITLLILLLLVNTPAIADNNNVLAYLTDFTVWLDSEQKAIQNSVIVVNDYAYLPIRDISNLFGYNVKWDDKTKSVLIENMKTSYVHYTPFKENDVWGYKDADGNVKIEPQYDYAGEFCEGVAIVQFKDYNYGFINMNGICIYEGIPESNFTDGTALVSRYLENPYTYDEDGNITGYITDCPKEYFFIDKSGNVITDSYLQALPFSEGLAVVQTEGTNQLLFDNNRRYSYIYKNGQFATESKFIRAESFKNGYANVVTEDGIGKIDKDFNFYPDKAGRV